MKRPTSPKERNLLKGAIRRVFSRSELREEALQRSIIPGYLDPKRLRVTKWSMCPDCSTPTPAYLMQVDHISPIIRINESLEDLTWTELIENRVWCSLSNLKAICKSCHKIKTKAENKKRRELKKAKK